MPRRTEREDRILAQLRQSRYAAVGDLARSFNVSEETIRRDLKRLKREGAVEKVHGGVTLSEVAGEPPFRRRMELNHAAKLAIGRRAAELTPENSTLFVDGGTTCCAAARFLRDVAHLTVVTCSLEVARTLIEGRVRVLLAPGELDPEDCCVYGPEAAEFVGRFNYTTALFSASGLHARLGCCDYKLEEATLKRHAAVRAEQVAVIADASKFERSGFAQFCDLEAVDLLITDSQPPTGIRRTLNGSIEIAPLASRD
ncbi:MAG: DeoR/GlpR family DNA-binding transcription regulator [Neomegalonema sp.]|nr:DeoR/GlpR family DNA-binding transcription regulator [Neomegalonema sp.]